MSVHSAPHLGESKRIEELHNGLFISWPDWQVQSWTVCLIWRQRWNQVGAGQPLCENGGLKVISLPSKWIQNLVYRAPKGCCFSSNTRTHSHTLTQINTRPRYTFQLPKLAVSLSIWTWLFLLFFFLSLMTFKSSNSDAIESSVWCCALCPPMSAFVLPRSTAGWEAQLMRSGTGCRNATPSDRQAIDPEMTGTAH